jgi:hypothetical protein
MESLPNRIQRQICKSSAAHTKIVQLEHLTHVPECISVCSETQEHEMFLSDSVFSSCLVCGYAQLSLKAVDQMKQCSIL